MNKVANLAESRCDFVRHVNHCYTMSREFSEMGLFAGTKWDLPTHCDLCGQLESDCQCPPPPPTVNPPEKQTLRVRVEKRKAGRLVTVITGLEQPSGVRADLLTQLKNSCGAGGSQEDTNLVLQGDQQARASRLLADLGYRIGK